jgi:phosphinothricin acetyltransferase
VNGFPFIVARDASGVLGFGTFGDFRAPPCYRHSVEHSVHVRADRRGQGVGRALIIELLARAAASSKHIMIAGIDADNAVSIGLHIKLGFSKVGHFHEVGFKFGRWLDLVFLQCIIPATAASAAASAAPKVAPNP